MKKTKLTAVAALALAGCSLVGGDPSAPSTSASEDRAEGETGGTVVLATHESCALPKKLVKAFEAETGYNLQVRAAGDAGTLATKLSLTADNPIAAAALTARTASAGRAATGASQAPA